MKDRIKVTEMYFDTKEKQPVLKLADGTTRVIYLVPTGNCWVEYWTTPKDKAESIAARDKADKEWRERAVEKYKIEPKKRWWNLYL